VTALSTPGQVRNRLEAIEHDLADRQNELEDAALAWFTMKRTREKEWAEAFLSAEGSVEQRKAHAARDTAHIGMDAEARWEGLRAVVRTLDTRAAIGMSLLRSQGRS
jgi:hypothetical protein